MSKFLVCVLIALSGSALIGSAGCSHKTTTVQAEQRTEESEPQMVSPGEEVLE